MNSSHMLCQHLLSGQHLNPNPLQKWLLANSWGTCPARYDDQNLISTDISGDKLLLLLINE